MIRTTVLALSLFAAPAFASPYYQAQTSAPPTQARLIVRDNVWTCSGSTCISGRAPSRPAIVCSSLVRKVGALRSFSVEGRAFEAAELESCNRRAR